MKLLALTCNHCGAPIEVPENTKFLACTYCLSRLAVRRTGNAVYTEVLEALEKKTDQIAKDVEVIKRQNELERLDRQWMVDRERHLVRGKQGEYRLPNAAGSLIGAAIAVVFGIFWIGMVASMPGGGGFALFGLIFILVAVGGALYNARKAQRYQRSKQNYQRQRQEVLRDLRDLEP